MTTSQKIIDFTDFIAQCNYFGIEVNNNQLNLFKKYYEILLEWNTKINLISRKEENILERHFLDSLSFLPEIESYYRSRGLSRQTPIILDIGSGGGFPAIPLAIMKPDWEFTLCESIKKKVSFLESLVKELNLNNVKIINTRVETLHATSQHKNKYDLVTVRAVAKLSKLIKYSIPLLKPKGFLTAYKAKDIEDELKEAEKIVEKNKLELKVYSKNLNGIERKLVVLTHSSIFKFFS